MLSYWRREVIRQARRFREEELSWKLLLRSGRLPEPQEGMA